MISAKVVAATKCGNSPQITTMQLVMPRFILAQFNTHRMFSRSTASSRAIPTAKLLEMVQQQPVMPSHWGVNQSGMQAASELAPALAADAQRVWLEAARDAVKHAKQLAEIGVHKQAVNRLLEPFLPAHTVVTATEWDGFFKLRMHDDAQPEMQALATAMHNALQAAKPEENNYHLPYVKPSEVLEQIAATGSHHKTYLLLLKVSAARCARVSYLNHDKTNPFIGRDLVTADKLLKAGHASPFEHQAEYAKDWIKSANFTGWRQARKLLESIGALYHAN